MESTHLPCQLLVCQLESGKSIPGGQKLRWEWHSDTGFEEGRAAVRLETGGKRSEGVEGLCIPASGGTQ